MRHLRNYRCPWLGIVLCLGSLGAALSTPQRAPSLPIRLTIEEVLAGGNDGRLVEVKGVVRSVGESGQTIVISIAGISRSLNLKLGEGDASRLAQLVDAVVQVRGIPEPILSRKGQRTGADLALSDSASITVLESAPPNPFASPANPIGNLPTLRPQDRFVRRVRLQGLVTLQRSSGSIYVQDETGAAFIPRPTSPPLQPGDFIDIIGFPDVLEDNVVLRDAIVMKREAGDRIQPRSLSTAESLDDRYNNMLAQIMGTVVAQDKNELVVRAGQYTFNVELDVPDQNEALPRLLEGTQVTLTGIYWVRYSESGRPVSFRLFLRAPGDVTVTQRPSWWTPTRIFDLVIIISFLTSVAFAWVWLLRRQVLRQTAAIRRQADQEAALHEQLRQSQKMEAVGLLAGGIAHDFNNVLTVIKGYGEIVLHGLDPLHPNRRDVEEIAKSADRAATLTQQLLAFSRQQVLAPKIINLNSVLVDLETMLRRLLGESVELSISVDPNLGNVKADPGQIEQVIVNLAVNARDAMARGGRLTIETASLEVDATSTGHPDLAAGKYASLIVRDTGVGMTPPVMARIFEPFFTTKEKGKGTGLGLATTYGIVRQSGGHISVSSKLGEGTTFKVFLPVAEGTAHRTASPPRKKLAAAGTETVLLVEDEDGLRTLIKNVLSAQGYNVLPAEDPTMAIQISSHFPGNIQLLLSDLGLPQMSGQQLAGKIAGQRPATRVLFISGYSDEAIAQDGVLSPGTGFLTKPFSPQALLLKVREVLDGKVVG